LSFTETFEVADTGSADNGLPGLPSMMASHQVPSQRNKSVWWPGLAAIACALFSSLAAIAMVRSVFGSSGNPTGLLGFNLFGNLVVLGLLGYLLGVLLTAIFATLQKAFTRRLTLQTSLTSAGNTVARLAVWLGLAAGLASAFAMATEIARW